MMKTKLIRNIGALTLTLALMQNAGVVRAANAKLEGHTTQGTVATVDAKGKTLKLHGWLGSLRSLNFHLAEGATVMTGQSKTAAPEDLKTGMEVRVHYKRVDGVRVATHIEQRLHEDTSFVKSVDLTTQQLTVERARLGKTFWLTEDTRILAHGKPAKLADLKPGQRVTVNYVRNGVALVAKSVNDPSELFSGTIEAINAEQGSVTMKYLLSRRTFALGADCRIVVDDSPKATLRDLRIGDRATISYRDVQGVLIAMRVTRNASAPAPPEDTTAALPPY